MKQISNASVDYQNKSEKWPLLLVILVGLGGLLLTFSSTPKEQHLDVEGLQLESRVITPEDAGNTENDYVLR